MDYHEKPLADRIAFRIQEYLVENVYPEFFESVTFKDDITAIIRDVLDETYGD